MRYSSLQLDVFTRRPFGGNQLSVFTDARGLSTDQMQALTREMNYSESTFVLPAEVPGCAKKVRIFTPGMEMPMAGHPTVGTAAALVATGLVNPSADHSLMLELNIGPVRVTVEPREQVQGILKAVMPFVWMEHRLPVFSPSEVTKEAVAHALGLSLADLRADLPLEVVSTGVPYLLVPLVSLDAAQRAVSEAAALSRLFAGHDSISVGLFTEEVIDPTAKIHARMFSPHLDNIVEDPATGSMAAPLGAYLARHNLLPHESEVTFLIEQGLEIHRPSQILTSVERHGADITRLRIGGDSVLVGEGSIFWEA
jgi:trans-2,3-dihydro-3-hydroxyanthranilate isomerase